MNSSVMLYFLRKGWQEGGTKTDSQLRVEDARSFFGSPEKPPQAHPLPQGQCLIIEHCLQSLTTDNNGDPLTYLEARELVEVLLRRRFRLQQSAWDTHVSVFVHSMADLSDEMPVVLYWC